MAETLEAEAVEAVIEKANAAISKLTNGVGVNSPDKEHSALAQGIVCLSQMMIPVYRHVIELQKPQERTAIKTKWFTATGNSMCAVAAVLMTGCVCYTVIKVLGK